MLFHPRNCASLEVGSTFNLRGKYYCISLTALYRRIVLILFWIQRQWYPKFMHIILHNEKFALKY